MTLIRRGLPGAAGILLTLSAGCTYLGSARNFNPEDLDHDSGWLAVRTVVPVRQEGPQECGVATLQMLLEYWNNPVERDIVLQACPTKEGVGIRARDMRDFARSFGLQAYLIHGDWTDFEAELSLGHPVAVGMIKPYVTGAFSHYEIVVAIHQETKDIVTIDPASGWRRNSSEGFRKEWDPAGRLTLIVYQGPPDARLRRTGAPMPFGLSATP
jgi:ABC-type bacteriocin/lantibiotic exporter with double-glycine peptidase domain